MKNIKFLLIPLTTLVWYFVTYFTLFGVYVSFPLISNLGWFWLIILYFLVIGIVSLLYSAAAGVCMSILYLYRFNWLAVIIHSLAGLLATISFMSFYSINYAMIVRNGIEIPLLSFMWEDSPFRVILLTPGFISIFVGIIYVMTILPIVSKLKSKNE